jgi:hypothetical protein
MVSFVLLEICGTGVCFPMGKGLYRVVHIPVDECVLLNSRDKAPYLICVEVLRCEAKRFGHFPYCMFSQLFSKHNEEKPQFLVY